MTEREQFEAWAKDSGLWTDKWNTAQDEYLSHGTTWAWNAWQARATPALQQTPQNACSCDRELKTGWTADNRIPLCNVCGMVDVSAAFEMSKEAPALPQGVEKAAIEKALRSAFNLGQTYWQQTDSESYSQNRKSDETLQKFNALVAETSSKLSGMAIVPVELLHDIETDLIMEITNIGRLQALRALIEDKP